MEHGVLQELFSPADQNTFRSDALVYTVTFGISTVVVLFVCFLKNNCR